MKENKDIFVSNDDAEFCSLNKSTSISNRDALYKRANSKYFTLGYLFHLLDLDSPLKKRYWNTYYCASALKQESGKITSKYCRNRWCITCSRIKTAQAIEKYSEEVKSWGDESYFVTLTIPNVPAEILSETIDTMQKNFTNINRYFRERLKEYLVGIRKLEVTYNPISNDYHPHYHVIVKGKYFADALKEQWLKRYPDALEYLQDVKKCYGNVQYELFKYVTKIISSKSSKDYSGSASDRRKIYISALDNIFTALDKRKTFETFGFKAKKIDIAKGEDVPSQISDKVVYWDWNNELSDWVCDDTGEFLTGYVPPENIKELLKNDIIVNKSSSKAILKE